jgi:hypothetical protein
MKKQLIPALLFIICGSFFSQEGDINFEEYQYDESVNFFNPNYVSSVPFFSPQNFTGGRIYFGVSDINSGFLDIGVALNSTSGIIGDPPTVTSYYRKGTWNANNSGNGSFGNPNNYYINETYGFNQDFNSISGCVFVKLRDNQSKSDLVVGRGQQDLNGLWVHWNNGSIGNVQQTVNGGNCAYIEKGKFTSEDDREDIIILHVSGGIRIFRNQGNGYLDPNYIPFAPPSVLFGKFKLKQMNDKDYDAGHWPDNMNDKADLVILDNYDLMNIKIKLFINNNSNGFNSIPWELGVPGTTDFDVADINADGYNDIIACGSYGTKIFLNILGSYIDPNPSWSNQVFGFNTPYVNVADINKDGFGDLVATGFDRSTKLFLNTRNWPIFNSTPDQFLEGWGGGHRNVTTQAMLADIYNQGGLAYICADWMSHTGPIMIENSLKVLNAVNYNPAPQPVVIKADLYNDNGIYRPRITINDTRRERDFSKYWVGKYNYVTMQQTAFPITTNTFIDYSEYVLATEDEGDAPPYNRWYSVIQMDLTSKWSPASNRVYFTVGSPVCYTCGVGDNPVNGNSNKPELPHEYSMKNFPNPFNPVTKIYYNIPEAGNIKITVYNIQGKSVQIVVNSFKGKGSHVAEFNGSNLPSGIYFYKLESKDIEISKKMILVK